MTTSQKVVHENMLYSTFFGVQVNLHSGVTTGVKNLTSVDLQDRHGSGSAGETTGKRVTN